MKQMVFLFLAILLEVAGSTTLKMSEQFTRLVPSVITIVAYIVAFYCLSLSLKTIPLGVAYAIWAGLGIVLTTVVSVVVFKQPINIPVVVGIALIIAGVVITNLFSKSVLH